METASCSSSVPNGNTFSEFFEKWITEQEQFLHKLISAADSHTATSSDDSSIASLQQLVDRVVHLYEHYYRVKSSSIKRDVLAIFNPAWLSSLEDAFLWIGGWRPSMAFHLLYSKSGLQLEARLSDLLRGIKTGDLGDLSPNQLKQMDRLQRETIREEKQITDEMAAHQETIADKSMVELSHALYEMHRLEEEERGKANGEAGSGGPGGGEESLEEQVQSTLKPKQEGLERVLLRADGLRLKTLKKVVEMLSPIQAVHFLIAAAELHLRIHEWGKKKDGLQQNGQGVNVAAGH